MTQTSITRSWVASANGHADFPLQNLPLGVFSVKGGVPRSGVAIGDHIFDLGAALDAGLFDDGAARAAVEATRGGQLNAFFELGREARVALRQRMIELFKEGSTQRGKIEAQGAKLLPLAADCQMHLPAKINDYTDLRRHRARAERWQTVPPGQPAAAELQTRADRLPRSCVHRARFRCRRAPPERPDLASRCDRADLRPVRASGL